MTPVPTQEELDHAYWRERVWMAVAALEAVEDDLRESRRRLRAAHERLAASRVPAPLVAWPIAIHPAWAKEEASSA
jgi:hypothetical protein